MSIESVIPSNHLILCRPLLLLPSIPPSIRVFSNESALRIRWPKYWSFSFSISPSSEHPGLLSFRIWDSHYPNYPVLRICNVSIWWAANLNQRKKSIWYSCHLQLSHPGHWWSLDDHYFSQWYSSEFIPAPLSRQTLPCWYSGEFSRDENFLAFQS